MDVDKKTDDPGINTSIIDVDRGVDNPNLSISIGNKEEIAINISMGKIQRSK